MGANKSLRSLVKPCIPQVIALCVLTVVQSLLIVAMAMLSRYVVDAALQETGKLAFWATLLVADILAIIIVYGFNAWLSATTLDRYVARLQQKLLASAFYSSNVRLHGFHSGELLSRGLEDVRTLADGLIGAIPKLVGQLASLVSAFGAIIVIYPKLAPFMILAAVAAVGLSALMRPVLKRSQRRVREAQTHVLTAMQEDLQQLELIQSIQAQKPLLQRFAERMQACLKALFQRRGITVGSNVAIVAFSQVLSGGLLLWGAVQVAAGVLSYGAMTAMLQLLAMFRSPVLGLSGIWSRISAVEVAAERLTDTLHTEEAEEPELDAPLQVKAIVFEDVTFAYPGEEAPVVEGLSLRFPVDGWCCLGGYSGKGKTTLFKLILGLYTPQKGRVYLETDQGEVPCSRQTRRLFAYVPQDYALFSGTVKENLLLVAPEADAQQRQEALGVACADFLFQTEAGEDTVIRENTGLSKGQLQRIAIARAVLMDCKILLLDECTSALDAQTEEQVLQNLKQLGLGAIVVTHRPAALKHLDGVASVNI